MAPSTFIAATGLQHLDYVLLLPSVDECVQRVATRKGHGFTDEADPRSSREAGVAWLRLGRRVRPAALGRIVGVELEWIALGVEATYLRNTRTPRHPGQHQHDRRDSIGSDVSFLIDVQTDRRALMDRPLNGADLFLLGRRLMKLGVAAMPPSGLRDMPSGVRMVLLDVIEHPGSTIGQIVERTGFPQSHVSGAVVRLREEGKVFTEPDAADRRRTRVEPSRAHLRRIATNARRLPPVDATVTGALVERLGPAGATRTGEAMDALRTLATLFDVPNQARPRDTTP